MKENRCFDRNEYIYVVQNAVMKYVMDICRENECKIECL